MNSDQTKFGTEISRRTAEARLAECKTQRNAEVRKLAPHRSAGNFKTLMQWIRMMNSFHQKEERCLNGKSSNQNSNGKSQNRNQNQNLSNGKRNPRQIKKQNQRESNRFSKRRTKQTQLVERLNTQSQHDSKSPSFGKRLRREGDYAQAN